MTRQEWEAECVKIEPRMARDIEAAIYDENYDRGDSPDETVCEWRQRRATGIADRRNGC